MSLRTDGRCAKINPWSVPARVAIVLYEGVQSLDVTGPLEVFSAANEVLDATARPEARYEVGTVATTARPLQTSSGLTVVPARALPDPRGRLDTLIVPGGAGARSGADPQLLDWVRSAARHTRRVASVCTGAFALAAAGLLDGRRATTHWAYAAELARRHPLVEVDPDPIFVRDGPVWTSAGVTAGIDLALALVEEDLDREVALAIARHLVMFLRRPGSQSQFSATLLAQQPSREPLREAQRLVLEDVAGEHTVEAMAARAHMSPRNFARAFRAQTGVTPARFVERVRLEAARRRLEESAEPIEQIARACGFGTPETMRRGFLRALRVSPSEYRRRFQPSERKPAAA